MSNDTLGALAQTIRREFAVLLKDQPELQAVLDLHDQLFRQWVLLQLAIQQRGLRIQADRQY